MSLPGEQAAGFREVFPLVAIPDVQGGHGRYRKDTLTLSGFTGCAGAHIYRGDRLPADFYGEYIIPEPVGRLVRRAHVANENGKIVVHNATPGTEFMRSRDANFRPVNAATGPDGCLYIVDMYRGIIQEGNWVRPGSYLRGVVENYGLDKNIGRGRIYRVVHETTVRGPKPALLKASPVELVSQLSHPNGWWRDEAQKLLVLSGDVSVAGALQALARTGESPLGRLHALWTLDGLGRSEPALLREKLTDSDPRVRAAAIRMAEPFLTAGDADLIRDVARLAEDPDVEVVIQLVLSLGHSGAPGGTQLVGRIEQTHAENENVLAIARSGRENLERAERRRQQDKFLAAGETNFQAICSACHAPDAKGTPVAGVPGLTLGAPLAGSPRVTGKKDIPIMIMLKGMTGELDGKSFPGPMLPLESFDDEWIAATLTYVRNSFGNKGGMVSTADVAAVRAALKDRKEMWQTSEILAMVPVSRKETKSWTLTASDNQGGCRAAVDGRTDSRWDTQATQHDGMWFAFDMGHERSLRSIVLDSSGSTSDYPREYSVDFSTDGTQWNQVVTKTGGSDAITGIVLPAEKTRYVRINQHGRSPDKFWSIHELEVYAQ
jgi:mono/diheme cytochrome c family protein